MTRHPSRRCSYLCWFALLAAACGPEAPPNFLSTTVETVLNGEDGRHELYEITPEELRQTLDHSIGALVWAHRIQFDGSRTVTIRAESLGATLDVCASERFAEQPSAARCSALLVDDNLVLTAGHCLGDDPTEQYEDCSRLRVVFGYALRAERELSRIDRNDVYSCRRVVARQHVHEPEGFLDFAFLELDRSATRRAPLTIASEQVEIGDRVLLASHGAGLPLKVEPNATVVSAHSGADLFITDTDSFGGGSGGALLDAGHELVGHQVLGEPDWEAADGCRRARAATEPNEQYQVVTTARDALCRLGWPSPRLCGTSARCGDGVCSGGEAPAACGDCKPPMCGDGLCEGSEIDDCYDDCRRFDDVPAGFNGDPITYRPASPPNTGALEQRGGCSLSLPSRASPLGSCMVLALWLVCRRARPRRRGIGTRVEPSPARPHPESGSAARWRADRAPRSRAHAPAYEREPRARPHLADGLSCRAARHRRRQAAAKPRRPSLESRTKRPCRRGLVQLSRRRR